MAEIKELAGKSVEALGLSEGVQEALKDIQIELAEAYRESFLEMVQAMKKQASAINRIQATLEIVLQHLDPKLQGTLPVALKIAGEDEEADVAKALVVADPIGTGYTLSQVDLAKALGLTSLDVSVLVRAFKLPEDGKCAVIVRQGKGQNLVNYHPRAVTRFLELVETSPKGWSNSETQVLKRVREKLIKSKSTS